MQHKKHRDAAELFLHYIDDKEGYVSAAWNLDKNLRMDTIRRKWCLLKALHDWMK